MGRQLRQQIGVVGQRLNFETGSVDVDTEQLCSVGTECHLFNLIIVDKSQKVAVPNVGGTVLTALNDWHVRRRCRGSRWWHVDGHGQTRAGVAVVVVVIAVGPDGSEGSKGRGLLGKEQTHEGGRGELHGECFVCVWD